MEGAHLCECRSSGRWPVSGSTMRPLLPSCVLFTANCHSEIRALSHANCICLGPAWALRGPPRPRGLSAGRGSGLYTAYLSHICHTACWGRDAAVISAAQIAAGVLDSGAAVGVEHKESAWGSTHPAPATACHVTAVGVGGRPYCCFMTSSLEKLENTEKHLVPNF